MTFRQSAVSADPFQGIMQVSTSFLEGLDTPRALSVFLLISNLMPHNPDEFAAELKLLTVDPQDGRYEFDITRFRFDYQATVLFSKLPSPVPRPELRSAALAGFLEGESRLSAINQRFLNESEAEAALFNLGVELQEVRQRFRQVLGRAPSLKSLARKGRWTSGASYLLPKRDADEATKCEYGVSCTLSLAQAISSQLSRDDLPLINWSVPWCLSPGNLVDTVPKNITTDRTMAKECEINMFFQSALGSVIRARLLDHGIDLNDQSNNQWACMNAQRLGLATIDLKNASNSISWALVQFLLPPDWVDLIFLLRSSRGTLDSRKTAISGKAEWFEYEMLSSMGNGFTFELESLLFFIICISAGVPDYNCYIYGDDIIIPQRYTGQVIPVLEYCGFALNTEKSFLAGAFFESCGVYAFQGVDVTPLKLKELLNGSKDCIILANKIRWFSHLSANRNGCDRRFLPAWQACVHRLPTDIRRRAHGPVGCGTLIWKNRNEVPVLRKEVRSRQKPDFQQEILYELRPTKKYREIFHNGLLIAAVSRVRAIDYYDDSFFNRCNNDGDFWNHIIDQAHGNRVPVLSEGTALGRIYHDGSSWYDLGTWQ